MIALNRGGRNVPVLMEDGRVIQAGWQGRSCVVGCAVAGATNLTPEHRRIGGDG